MRLGGVFLVALALAASGCGGSSEAQQTKTVTVTVETVLPACGEAIRSAFKALQTDAELMQLYIAAITGDYSGDAPLRKQRDRQVESFYRAAEACPAP